MSLNWSVSPKLFTIWRCSLYGELTVVDKLENFTSFSYIIRLFSFFEIPGRGTIP